MRLALGLLLWASIAATPSLLGATEPELADFKDHRVEFRGKTYRILEADLTKVRLGMFWKDSHGLPYSTLSRLKDAILAQGHRFLGATNAGIYSKKLEPLGLYVEKGKKLVSLNLSRGGGNFFMKPNGVFFLSASGARIVESSKFKKVAEHVTEATQSGPLLVDQGVIHHSFTGNSLNRKVRNGIGVRDPHHVVVALSEEPVNFDDFANLFKEKLGCPNALYLDGTISRIQGKSDSGGEIPFPFVGMIAFFKD